MTRPKRKTVGALPRIESNRPKMSTAEQVVRRSVSNGGIWKKEREKEINVPPYITLRLTSLFIGAAFLSLCGRRLRDRNEAPAGDVKHNLLAFLSTGHP